jgi:hypothetical protein
MTMAAPPVRGKASFLRSPAGVALVLFGAVAAFFLIAEHRAHALGILPFLLLLACPLIHLSMHRGHGGHGGGGDRAPGSDPHAGHRREDDR